MLNNIKLKNFKAFRELNDLDFKPITILCGANSCGKSSILNSVLLLKQSIESRTAARPLSLNGRYVHLGIFENLIYKKDKNEDIDIAYSFEISKNKRNALYYNDSMKNAIKMLDMILTDEQINELNKNGLQLEFNIVLGISKLNNQNKYSTSIQINKFSITIYSKTNKKLPKTKMVFKISNSIDKKYNINCQNIKKAFFRDSKLENKMFRDVSVEFINFIPNIYNDKKIDDGLDRVGQIDIRNYIMIISEVLRAAVSNFTYIGPLREEPARRYIYEDEIMDIGVKGENAPYLYSQEYNITNLKEHYFYDKETEHFHMKKNISLQESMEKWLELMNINNLKAEESNEIIRLMLDSVDCSDTRVSIADVGFGVSQIFPILLEGLRMPIGSTLLLEQPEIHLHPELQMKMSDYFIALALSGKSLIVETHSDHVINRLIRRIIEDDDNRLNDLINIYFVQAREGGSIVEKIKIDETKGIVNWPEGFFDQMASEQEKILRAGIAKRKKIRSKYKENL